MTWPMKEAQKKRMELIGIECRVRELPEDISQREFEKEFQKINQDPFGPWNSFVSSASGSSG